MGMSRGSNSPPAMSVSAAEALIRRRESERCAIEDLLTDPEWPSLSAGTVVRTVLACSRELASVPADVEWSVTLAAMARARLRALAQAS